MIGDEKHCARMLHNRLCDANLACVEIAQGAVGFNSRRANHCEIDAKLADEVDRHLPDDALVPRPHATSDAIRRFSSWQICLGALYATFSVLEGMVTPPWKRRSRSMSANQFTSRRMVCGVT